MSGSTTESVCCKHHLEEVLLDYLEAPHVTAWAGGDGLTVEGALCCYPRARAASQVPGRQELLTRHPELAEELALFFTPADAQSRPQALSPAAMTRARMAPLPVG